MNASRLTFGIYPLGVAGTPTGLAVGPKDDYAQIQSALRDLRGETNVVLPRNYMIYTGPASTAKLQSIAETYLHNGQLGDLTIGCMQTPDIDLPGWLEFVRTLIRQYGVHLASLQITNEPNLTFMEGSKPYVLQALVEGVLAAKREARELDLPLHIGFGSVPESPVALPHFWERLAELGGNDFVNAIDFVGHNFYVDVFEEPLDLKDIPASVERTLRDLREKHLVAAGIPAAVPIRVTENGWPTGRNPFVQAERSYERQAAVLETVIRTVDRLREELHITQYVLFGLRDADSSKDDLFHQFGIVRDDYSPKPAYDTFKRLIRELGN
ncbi:hypothetical protein PAESOLCIP111_00988 [Paenibacillus solanacearum]|uniref:Uncharacterized protein n=1 Tax=Paenibacillus solanacearum TaxID=2048548 RepID=A0A916JX98_9BACL|nr:hypothetical protein [Paenibacillus solanacearum]CAG7607723.1 hypothetical protein PAESOLCIP111_00988 [Paenibacillus solanacearum]